MTNVVNFDGEEIDLDNPPEDKKIFLQDRGLLQGESVPVTFLMPDGTVVSNNPEALQLNVAMDDPRIQSLVERRAREIAMEQVTAMQAASASVSGEDSGKATTWSEWDQLPGTPVPTEDDLGPGGGSSGGRLGPDDYESATNDDLRAEIAARNAAHPDEEPMSVSGRKSELIAALEEWDEDHAEEEG